MAGSEGSPPALQMSWGLREVPSSIQTRTWRGGGEVHSRPVAESGPRWSQVPELWGPPTFWQVLVWRLPLPEAPVYLSSTCVCSSVLGTSTRSW